MKNRQFLSALAALLLAIGLAQTVPAQKEMAQKELPPPNPEGEIVTLYAHDALTNNLSLNDGKPGAVIQSNLVFNRDSQLSFDSYDKDSFRVGIQGGERGIIIDLGTAKQMESRYGYAETVGSAQGFVSIHLVEGRAVIVKDYRTRQFQSLLEFDELEKPRESGDVAPVVVGHSYIVRIMQGDKVLLNAKLKVLAFTPGQYVTIRWARL